MVVTDPYKVMLTDPQDQDAGRSLRGHHSTHSRHRGCSGLGAQVISRGDEDISGEIRGSVNYYVEKVGVRSDTYGTNQRNGGSILAPTVQFPGPHRIVNRICDLSR